ncbi:transposase family protein [Phaeobacter gallaeciensis]|nr:transposase family protein [Phaeobacter gallaeciensis]MDE4142858.1 transposase family protein [Phaeobacter gallaeciensis]MDE4151319.1 transposase family protein [Phaeobacter gallaeciensis]MDE4155514.1 transposase family protein [Phaeobacter gallaeciensis]MDE4230942.1 transposase family protein [Phaeobacter gallaeciensis]MDE4264209.1 transposase family protein [Phaeobacter gallaeciensis]
MASQFSRRDLLPASLRVDQDELSWNTVRVHSRFAKAAAAYPRCGTVSRHVHSRYPRRPADLPTHGRKVQLLHLILMIPFAYSSGMASSIS